MTIISMLCTEDNVTVKIFPASVEAVMHVSIVKLNSLLEVVFEIFMTQDSYKDNSFRSYNL